MRPNFGTHFQYARFAHLKWCEAKQRFSIFTEVFDVPWYFPVLGSSTPTPVPAALPPPNTLPFLGVLLKKDEDLEAVKKAKLY